jgi:hypothetical protein
MNTSNLTLLAIDPGESSGVAIKIKGEYVTRTVTEAHVLWEFFHAHYDAIIYEQFNAQIISSHGLHTVRLVGGIEALVYRLGLTGYAHAPQKRRAFLKEAHALLVSKYQQLGHNVAFTVHEQDALAHMLAFEYALSNTEVNTHGIVVPIRTKGTRTNG